MVIDDDETEGGHKLFRMVDFRNKPRGESNGGSTEPHGDYI